ncbi:MAG: SLC13 family permease [Candidatus Krumholzibacteriia bacterium]
MTFEIALTLAILLMAVILFATERLPVDLVALGVMAALMSAGVVTAEEGISGFSNTATITVGAMFVLSAGLFKTGAVGFVGSALASVGKRSFWFALFTIMVVVGALSAFINNTAAVAIFLPIVLGVARDTRISPSKWLMPLSFASMFGGVCTLIGTSTNILVSSITEQHGQPPFAMFEFARLGLLMFGVGVLYMMSFGTRLIPERRDVGDLTQTFGMGDYLTEIVLLPEAKSVGKALKESALGRDLDIAILEVRRESQPLLLPTPETILEAGDSLLVRCSVEKIKSLQQRVGVALKPSTKWRDEDLESSQSALVEAVISPNSALNGRSLKDTRFRNRFGAVVLAIRHHGQLLHENLANTILQAGDALLLEIRRVTLTRLKRSPEFVIVSEVGLPEFRKSKIMPALLIIIGVVVSATLHVFPIVASAVIGCFLLVITGCISLEEAYRAIEWRVIFLLAGVLTLGVAMETTGAALLISSWMVRTVGVWGPVALVSAFYVVTSLLTQVISNNATAVLLAPVAIATAESLGVNSRPFLAAVTFAASASFMTPVGYQTNTLVYGPGQYKFADFMRVGAPLNLMFWLMASFLIPRFWPL